MKTFSQFVEDEMKEGIVDTVKRWAKAPVKKKQPKKNDSSHYRTNHHYGYGDFDPETVPIFKPTHKTTWK
jgi:hypothetical protein